MRQFRLDTREGRGSLLPMAPETTPAAAAAPPVSKLRTFLRRLGSSLALWSVVLFCIFSDNRLLSNYAFLGIMMVLAGFGLVEFYGLVEKRGLVCFKWWGVAAGLLLMLSTGHGPLVLSANNR